jgi:hypothetical protein
MSLTKWKTSKWSIEIERIEIERETDASVFLKTRRGDSRREAKRSTYIVYHDSWSDAREYLIAREEGLKLAAGSMLDRALKNISDLDSMAEPQ